MSSTQIWLYVKCTSKATTGKLCLKTKQNKTKNKNKNKHKTKTHKKQNRTKRNKQQ